MKKHLLLASIFAIGSQFTWGQQAVSEELINEINAKISSNSSSLQAIQESLNHEEYKAWISYNKPANIENAEVLKGSGSYFYALNGVVSSFEKTAKEGPYDFISLGSTDKPFYCDDVNADGKLYAINNDTKEVAEFFENGIIEIKSNIIGIDSDAFITGLSYNSSDDKFYIIAALDDVTKLYELDVESGATTLVDTLSDITVGIWLEFDNNNTAYIADVAADGIFKYDLTSQTSTFVGEAGYNLSYAQDADFDSETGILYTGYFAITEIDGEYLSGFATIDTSTGAYTEILSLEVYESIMFSVAEELEEGEEPEAPTYTCGDVFTDAGGVNGDYPTNADEVYVLTPSNADEVVTVTFEFVDIESSTGSGSINGCWDYLSIYNGDSTSSDVLAASLCGSADNPPSVASSYLQAGDSFTSTDDSGALTITFKSDNSVNLGGWEANITCANLAVDEVQSSKFNFYPNPTSGVLNVNAKSNIEKIEVYNVLGQKVLEFYPSASKANLNMSSLKAGTYFLNATVDGKTVTNKVLKK